MAKNYTPKNFAIQQVFEILLRDPSSKAPIAYLDNCKTTGLTNEQTMVYPTGARGNVYIGGGFGHSRRASMSVTNATWNTGVMGIQIGSEISTGANSEVIYYDTLEVKDGVLKTKYQAQGTVGEEIGTLYKLELDGTYGTTYTQAVTTDAEENFSYASATGTITFNEGVSLTDGDRYACAYAISSGESAQTIPVVAAGQPKTALVTAMGLVKDIETGEFYQAQINGLAQISGAWNWDLSADGEPASQSLDLEFVKKYSAKNLYEIIVWNEEDAKTVTE